MNQDLVVPTKRPKSVSYLPEQNADRRSFIVGRNTEVDHFFFDLESYKPRPEQEASLELPSTDHRLIQAHKVLVPSNINRLASLTVMPWHTLPSLVVPEILFRSQPHCSL